MAPFFLSFSRAPFGVSPALCRAAPAAAWGRAGQGETQWGLELLLWQPREGGGNTCSHRCHSRPLCNLHSSGLCAWLSLSSAMQYRCLQTLRSFSPLLVPHRTRLGSSELCIRSLRSAECGTRLGFNVPKPSFKKSYPYNCLKDTASRMDDVCLLLLPAT